MLNYLQMIICLFIFITSFCRAKKMDLTTRREIRWSMAALGALSLGVAMSPWAWGIEANGPVIAFEACVAIVQYVTGSLWSKGVPAAFRR